MDIWQYTIDDTIINAKEECARQGFYPGNSRLNTSVNKIADEFLEECTAYRMDHYLNNDYDDDFENEDEMKETAREDMIGHIYEERQGELIDMCVSRIIASMKAEGVTKDNDYVEVSGRSKND